MTAAHIRIRSPRYLANKGRTISAEAHPYVAAAAATVGALAIMALVNHRLAKKAESDNPAAGRFLDVNGVRLIMSNVARARRWFCYTATAA